MPAATICTRRPCSVRPVCSAREAELVEANATVKLLFQPGEETFEGARAAIADGLLQNPRPQAAFAMHVNSQSPLGLVLYGSPALSGVYGFRITLQGKGGHGSSPEICIDPITAGVHVHLALQELIAREVPAAKEVALTVGKFAGGLAANVIPDTCVLEGTLRGFDVELMAHLRPASPRSLTALLQHIVRRRPSRRFRMFRRLYSTAI